jgi:hypothetical protein
MGSIRVDFGGQRLLVEYDYSPATADVMYLPNGDPGYPGDPEEFYITGVKMMMPNGSWLDIGDLYGELVDGSTEDPLSKATYEAMCTEAEAGQDRE